MKLEKALEEISTEVKRKYLNMVVIKYLPLLQKIKGKVIENLKTSTYDTITIRPLSSSLTLGLSNGNFKLYKAGRYHKINLNNVVIEIQNALNGDQYRYSQSRTYYTLEKAMHHLIMQLGSKLDHKTLESVFKDEETVEKTV